MYFDTPPRYVGTLYDETVYGDQPLGWDIMDGEHGPAPAGGFCKYFASTMPPHTVIAVAAERRGKYKQKWKIILLRCGSMNHLKQFLLQNIKSARIEDFYKPTEQRISEVGFGRTADSIRWLIHWMS